MESENRKTILFALAANLFIAVAKLAGGVLTGPEDILVAARLELADALTRPSVESVMDELQRGVRHCSGACGTPSRPCSGPSSTRRRRETAGRRRSRSP